MNLQRPLISTVANTLNARPRFPLTIKNVTWITMFIMALAVLFTVDLPFLNPHHPYRPYHLKVAPVLLPHLIFGCIAIFSGPIQFSNRFRARYPQYHRIIGRVYVASILIAAPLGAMIPFFGPKDPFATMGVLVHASAWFITTLMAFLTARNRHILQHKQWMVRSYVVTFSFIFVRAISSLWAYLHFTNHQFGMVDCILTFLYILCADVALDWHQITTSRRR